MSLVPVRETARGRWRGILPHFGIPAKFLDGKQHPCPICGGKDRARFDDKEGAGTFFCNRCGGGDGLKLLELKTGLSFADVAKQVEELAGIVTAMPSKPRRSDDECHAAMAQAWHRSKPVEAGDPVSLWLESRVGPMAVPPSLRFSEQCWCSCDQSNHPAMLALMHDPDRHAVMVHRTYLTLDGRKAGVAEPRMTMPGRMPDGSAVRLAQKSVRMGIAEGIETALAASKLFDMPVWAALNSGMLEKWRVPAGVEAVVICGDNDASFTGQASAYALAKRLRNEGYFVEVRIPENPGDDWNDVLRSYGPQPSDHDLQEESAA